jgi:hypothetical protein
MKIKDMPEYKSMTIHVDECAIASVDSMVANASGEMPSARMIDADKRPSRRSPSIATSPNS